MKKIKGTFDPGHGGKDRANRGPSGKYVEADGALDICLKVKKKLESTGAFEIQLTRDKDATLGLTERAKKAIANKSDFFISQHTNAGGSKATGAEAFYSVDLPGNREFAAELSSAIAKTLGIKNRGAKTRESVKHKGEDYYTVIDAAQDGGIPVVFIIESAFHSNPVEEKLLLTKREEIAEAQAKAICKHYGVTYPVKAPEKPKPTETPKKDPSKYGLVTASVLNVRSGRGTDYSVIGKLEDGQKVKLLYLQDGWWSIDVPMEWSRTGVGFINAKYIKEVK